MKCTVHVLICAVALLLGIVESTSIPLIPVYDDYDYDYDRFTYYDIFSDAITKSAFNRHKLVEAFPSGELILCVPVTYILKCDVENCTENCTEPVNCTYGYQSPLFLWTYFDMENYAGRFLFYLTKSKLNYFLLGVSNKSCPATKDRRRAITLYLQVTQFPPIRSNISDESLIIDTLQHITGTVS